MRFPIVIESDECICKRALDDIQPIRMQDVIDLLRVSFDRVETYKVHIGEGWSEEKAIFQTEETGKVE